MAAAPNEASQLSAQSIPAQISLFAEVNPLLLFNITILLNQGGP